MASLTSSSSVFDSLHRLQIYSNPYISNKDTTPERYKEILEETEELSQRREKTYEDIKKIIYNSLTLAEIYTDYTYLADVHDWSNQLPISDRERFDFPSILDRYTLLTTEIQFIDNQNLTSSGLIQGKYYFLLKDFDQAVCQFRRESSNNICAQNGLIIAYLFDDLLFQAKNTFQNIMPVQAAKSIELLITEGLILFYESKFAEAEVHFEKIMNECPHKMAELGILLCQYMQDRKNKLAIQTLQLFIQNNDNFIEHYTNFRYYITGAYIILHNASDENNKWFEKAIEYDLEFTYKWLNKYESPISMNKLEKYLSTLQFRTIKELKILIRLKLYSTEISESESAIGELHTLLKQITRLSQPYFSLYASTYFFYLNCEYQRALHNMDDALVSYPNAFECRILKAKILLRFSLYTELETELIKLLELNDCYSEVYYLYSIYHYHELQFDKSLFYIIKALQLHPHHTEYLYLQSKIYRNLKEYKKAAESITVCIELDPDNSHAFKLRAEFNYYLGQYENVIHDLDTLQELLGTRKEELSVLKMAAILESFDIQDEQFDIGTIIEILLSCNRSEQHDEFTLETLAYAYYVKGDIHQSLFYCNETLKLNNNNIKCLYLKSKFYFFTKNFYGALININKMHNSTNNIVSNRYDLIKCYYSSFFLKAKTHYRLREFKFAQDSLNVYLQHNKTNKKAFRLQCTLTELLLYTHTPGLLLEMSTLSNSKIPPPIPNFDLATELKFLIHSINYLNPDQEGYRNFSIAKMEHLQKNIFLLISYIDHNTPHIAVPEDDTEREQWYSELHSLLTHIFFALKSEPSKGLIADYLHDIAFNGSPPLCGTSWRNEAFQIYTLVCDDSLNENYDNASTRDILLKFIDDFKLSIVNNMAAEVDRNTLGENETLQTKHNFSRIMKGLIGSGKVALPYSNLIYYDPWERQNCSYSTTIQQLAEFEFRTSYPFCLDHILEKVNTSKIPVVQSRILESLKQICLSKTLDEHGEGALKCIQEVKSIKLNILDAISHDRYDEFISLKKEENLKHQYLCLLFPEKFPFYPMPEENWPEYYHSIRSDIKDYKNSLYTWEQNAKSMLAYEYLEKKGWITYTDDTILFSRDSIGKVLVKEQLMLNVSKKLAKRRKY